MPSPISAHDLISNPEPITFGDYTDGWRINASYTKSLASALRNGAPSDLTKVAIEQLALVDSLAIDMDDILTERRTVAAVRPFLADFVAAFGGMNDALLGKSRLPASLSGAGQRAAKLHAQLFTDGVMFTRKDAHAAWSEGDRILRVIAPQGLKSELDEVLGSEFFASAKKATTSLREALGIGKTALETPSTTRLQQALSRFSREVCRYARMLAGDVDLTNGPSVERFRRAVMTPIDTFRTRRGVGEVEPEMPEMPEPAAPSEPGEPVIEPSPGGPFIEG